MLSEVIIGNYFYKLWQVFKEKNKQTRHIKETIYKLGHIELGTLITKSHLYISENASHRVEADIWNYYTSPDTQIQITQKTLTYQYGGNPKENASKNKDIQVYVCIDLIFSILLVVRKMKNEN